MKRVEKIVFSNSEDERFEGIRLLLGSLSYQYKNLQSLAQSEGINLTKLKKKFKQIYGTSIYQYLLQVRIERAKQLLQENSITLKGVALECGFKNYQHFSTTFKKWTGVTPKGYRLNQQ